MQILILYSTIEGHTAKIAKKLADAFEDLDNEVFLSVTSDPGYCDPGTFDATILCAPIHMGSYPGDFIDYIENWKSALSQVPNALVTSSLMIACADEDEQTEAKSYPTKLTKQTGWQPSQVYNVAGSLNYPEYGFFKRWLMKRAAQTENWPDQTDKEHDFTDWKALKTFAKQFADSLKKEVA
ncbi:MAG: flavodoxin domain-containing protein [Rhizobiaceae bacterium]|nr:flavodoxin domain-containing protein [Rhizobiaceae bacterium]